MPRRAKAVPSYSGSDAAPRVSAPPWNHTMTGRRPRAPAGRQTLRYRQSSLTGAPSEASPARGAGCRQAGPNALAARSVRHGATGCGARQRSAPTGGAAYGMPLKATTLAARSPRTGPLSSCATSLAASAAVVQLNTVSSHASPVDRFISSLQRPSVALGDIEIARFLASSNTMCSQISGRRLRHLTPRKLLQSKWTAVVPQGRQKHFVVVRLIECESPEQAFSQVEIEAVHSRRRRIIEWRELRDPARWHQGWC